MTWKTPVLIFTLVAFGLLTYYAMWQVGYIGIFTSSFANWGTAQVFGDLVVASVLIMVWMVSDARARGLNAWPFVLVTLLAGSFGVLFYLLRRGVDTPAVQAV